MVINFDDLILKRKSTLRKCFNFLNLSFQYSGKKYHYQNSKIRINKVFKGKESVDGMGIDDVQSWDLSPGQKKYIYKKLRNDIKKFSIVYNVDISSWNFYKYY